MIHHLKTWSEQFGAIIEKRKRFEYRGTADRSFYVGDLLVLDEYNQESKTYMGRSVVVEVIYVLRGPAFGIPEGFCVMSISDPISKISTQADGDCKTK